MSGETEHAPSGWTIDSLKAHLEQMLADLDRRHTEALHAHAALDMTMHTASETALATASASMEKRLDGMNEFRDQLRDQSSTFLPRSEYDRAHMDLANRVDAIDAKTTERFGAVNSRLDTTQGRSGGLNAGWGYLVGAVGFIVAIVSLANMLAARP